MFKVLDANGSGKLSELDMFKIMKAMYP